MELVRFISIVVLVANAAFADVNLPHFRSLRAQALTPPSTTAGAGATAGAGSSVATKKAWASTNLNSLDVDQLRALLHEIISHSSESCLDEATASGTAAVTAASTPSLMETKAKAKDTTRITCRVAIPSDNCCCGETNYALNGGLCPDRTPQFGSGPAHCCCQSCFSAETNVTMADGSLKQIASLRAGERVRTVDGTATVVLAEQRETGGRNLFGFNHGIPFFTEEHIFMTKKGPRALNPLALAQEDPSYQGISELMVGDELINPQGESVVIESIDSAEKPFDTPVYNILLDTAHTYFANGHLVSDLFPRLDKFPFTFKLLHWLWRERSSQVNSFFIDTLGRDEAAIELPTIHKDAEFAELFGRIKNTIDTFVEERS
jgi:hypothetical protein